MRLNEFLRGYRIDRDNIQNVGVMTVVPIVSDQEFTSAIADVDEVYLKRDIDYSTLQFENRSGKVGIILQGASIISKQRAQDRTVPLANIIKGKQAVNAGAFCIQSSQPGHFNPETLEGEREVGVAPYRILPPTLRRDALLATWLPHGPESYSALWNHITRYIGFEMGPYARAHMEDIYNRLAKDLDQFVAQFEPVANQLGAIVMVNRQVIAVDIMPTYKSWKLMWSTLIRDSYGLEAIRVSKHESPNPWVFQIHGYEPESLEDALEAIETERNVRCSEISAAWGAVAAETVVTSAMNKVDGVELLGLESDTFFGQSVLHDNHVVYMSLIPKGSKRQSVPKLRRRSQNYSNEDFRF